MFLKEHVYLFVLVHRNHHIYLFISKQETVIINNKNKLSSFLSRSNLHSYDTVTSRRWSLVLL